MISEGITYGTVIKTEWLEERLKQPRDTMKFGLEVSEIRRALESRGLYLTGRGQKSNQFVVVDAAANSRVMGCYSRAASDALRRGVTLGTNTPVDSLGPDERRRHEAVLERMAIKVALMSRAKAVAKVVAKHNPELLTERSEISDEG
jgi:hypothetical protein